MLTVGVWGNWNGVVVGVVGTGAGVVTTGTGVGVTGVVITGAGVTVGTVGVATGVVVAGIPESVDVGTRVGVGVVGVVTGETGGDRGGWDIGETTARVPFAHIPAPFATDWSEHANV